MDLVVNIRDIISEVDSFSNSDYFATNSNGWMNGYGNNSNFYLLLDRITTIFFNHLKNSGMDFLLETNDCSESYPKFDKVRLGHCL